MNLWQMLLARRGLMDVAEAHERGGGAGGVLLLLIMSRAHKILTNRVNKRAAEGR